MTSSFTTIRRRFITGDGLWQAVSQHTVKQGMSEFQTTMALGNLQQSDSKNFGNRTVEVCYGGSGTDTSLQRSFFGRQGNVGDIQLEQFRYRFKPSTIARVAFLKGKATPSESPQITVLPKML